MTPRGLPLVARMSRAAVFYGAATLGACWTNKGPEKIPDRIVSPDDNPQQFAKPPGDAGADAARVAPVDPDDQVDPDEWRQRRGGGGCHNGVCPPYGAPPPRRRLV